VLQAAHSINVIDCYISGSAVYSFVVSLKEHIGYALVLVVQNVLQAEQSKVFFYVMPFFWKGNCKALLLRCVFSFDSASTGKTLSANSPRQLHEAKTSARSCHQTISSFSPLIATAFCGFVSQAQSLLNSEKPSWL
jgi:hypothetical protein